MSAYTPPPIKAANHYYFNKDILTEKGLNYSYLTELFKNKQ